METEKEEGMVKTIWRIITKKKSNKITIKNVPINYNDKAIHRAYNVMYEDLCM